MFRLFDQYRENYKRYIKISYIYIYFYFLTIILPEQALKSQNLTSIIRCIKLEAYDNEKIYRKEHVCVTLESYPHIKLKLEENLHI